MHKNNVTLNTVLDILGQLTTKTQLMEYVTNEDLVYIRKRSNRESIEFLTRTLPLLGKALEKGLATGLFVLPAAFKAHPGTQLPRLLYKAFSQLFGADGVYREISTPFTGTEIEWFIQLNQATACLAIRQVTLLVYKAKLKHTPEQLDRTKEAFMRSEDLCWETTKRGHSQWSSNPKFLKARALVHCLLGGVNPYEIKPKHGSGASAEKSTPWDRYTPELFIPKLDAVFPYTEYFCTWPNGLGALSIALNDMAVDESPPSRVCFVPKDSRGPRQISCEPSPFMFVQQGLMSTMYGKIQLDRVVRSQLDCEDQTRNQRAAEIGSITGDVATIDLSEASDCLSYSLVRFLFPEDWLRAFEACRSETTIFPDGDEVFLWKFAPMGSACCFPVEAIVFWALTCAVVYPDPVHALFPAKRHVRYKHPTISIFGDDICCPTQHALEVCEVLELAGLKVNHDKSYLKGPFRESCGTDWFLGFPVRIVRLNNLPLFDDKTKRIHIASAFRLLDFAGEIQKNYGPGLDAWFKQFLDEWNPDQVLPVLPERPSGSYCLGSTSIPQIARTRLVDPLRDIRKPYYGSGREASLLMEVGVKQQIEISDWCHILRPMLQQAGDRAEVVGLKDRTRYKRKWVLLNCVTAALAQL